MSDLTAMNHQTLKLREQLMKKFSKIPPNVCLLLDVSGSMKGRRIAQLKALAAGFQGVRRFEFSTHVRELLPQDIMSDAEGSTALDVALTHLKSAGVKHCVIITDGEPNNEDAALQASIGLKVDILFAGDPPVPPFLERLAKMSGGKYQKVTLDDIRELDTKVRLLLPEGTRESIKL